MNDRSESSASHNLQGPAADQTEGRGHRWVTIRASMVGLDGRVKGDQKGRTVCKSVSAQQTLRPCTSRAGDAESIPLIIHRHSSNRMEELNAIRVLLLAEAIYRS